MYYDKLEMQKKYIMKERKVNIFLLSVGLFFLILFLWATICDLRGLFLSWMPVMFVLLVVKWIMGNNRLLKQFSSIVENNSINKTYEITLDSPKIVFRACPKIYTNVSSLREYYGITIIDDQKKYYYFFDECVWYDKASFKRIQEKLSQELHIQCYENTCIIRSIENDPRFLRVRFSSFCK